MSTATKLEYLNDTKGLLKDSINSLGGEITSQTTFRNYATELDSIYSNLPKVSDTGSNISLSPTLKGRLGSVLKGNTLQDGTPTPDSPVEIQSATGLQTITVSDGTNTQTKELNLGNIKLNKIGNYQDYITGKPDNWSINRKIGSVVLDGTGQWSKATRTTYVNNSRFINHSIQLKNDANNIIVISDYFNGYSLLDLNINDSIGTSPARNSASDTSYFLVIQISKNLLSTDDINGFKSWLSTHNTQVDYVLATPTTEPITNQEIINQLNEIYNLQSYNETTNITITSEDLEMIMTASALKGEA